VYIPPNKAVAIVQNTYTVSGTGERPNVSGTDSKAEGNQLKLGPSRQFPVFGALSLYHSGLTVAERAVVSRASQ